MKNILKTLSLTQIIIAHNIWKGQDPEMHNLCSVSTKVSIAYHAL